MSEFYELLKEFKTKCDEPLSTGWIKTRKGDRNHMVKYLEASYVLRALNHVFTPLGWSRSVESHSFIHEERTKKGQWKVTAECKMTLKLHPFSKEVVSTHTDIGIGKSFASDQGVARGSALKNAYTDAIKRCGKTLGDFFGLGLTLDEETAERIGATQRTQANPTWVFSEETASSEKFPWLSGDVYRDILEFFEKTKNAPQSLIQISLRDRILENANDVYHKAFRISSTDAEDEVFEILHEVTSGRPVPNIGEVKAFLTKVNDVLRDGRTQKKTGNKITNNKRFQGEGVGYKIIEANSGYSESRGNFVELILAVPEKEAYLSEKIYYDSKSFDNLVVTSQGEKALSPQDARECPEILVGRWGIADFTEDDKGTYVDSWRPLENQAASA